MQCHQMTWLRVWSVSRLSHADCSCDKVSNSSMQDTHSAEKQCNQSLRNGKCRDMSSSLWGLGILYSASWRFLPLIFSSEPAIYVCQEDKASRQGLSYPSLIFLISKKFSIILCEVPKTILKVLWNTLFIHICNRSRIIFGGHCVYLFVSV